MPPRLIALVAPALLLLQGQAPPAPLRGGLSYGIDIYAAPVVGDVVPPRAVDVRPDAVIAAQRADIMSAAMVLDRGVGVGAPFNQKLDAGDMFRLGRTAAGDRWCLARMPHVQYVPAHDEEGVIYPGLCLLDADADGAFEAVRMLPYDPAHRERTVAIAPVQLRPAPPAPDPRISRHQFLRRLRIVSASESEAVLVQDFGFANERRPEPFYDPASESRTMLPLRRGASLAIGGVTLRVVGRTGAFTPWVRLEREGAAVRAGGYYLSEHED